MEYQLNLAAGFDGEDWTPYSRIINISWPGNTGARVGLTALNILGTTGHSNLVDHLFLWQPAVADNALTNDSSRDVHPLGLGVFPSAHSTAHKSVVLRSRGDGILGAGADDNLPSII